MGADGLAAALIEALNGAKPEPDALASAVRRRFGRDRFTRQVRAILARLGEAPRTAAPSSQQAN